jgi:hypothetical protein
VQQYLTVLIGSLRQFGRNVPHKQTTEHSFA